MKVVIPGTSTRVSREAAMAENLVFEDMADMDYCQLVVDDIRSAVVRYQQGTSRGKAVTGCAIAPLSGLGLLFCFVKQSIYLMSHTILTCSSSSSRIQRW